MSSLDMFLRCCDVRPRNISKSIKPSLLPNQQDIDLVVTDHLTRYLKQIPRGEFKKKNILVLRTNHFNIYSGDVETDEVTGTLGV